MTYTMNKRKRREKNRGKKTRMKADLKQRNVAGTMSVRTSLAHSQADEQGGDGQPGQQRMDEEAREPRGVKGHGACGT